MGIIIITANHPPGPAIRKSPRHWRTTGPPAIAPAGGVEKKFRLGCPDDAGVFVVVLRRRSRWTPDPDNDGPAGRFHIRSDVEPTAPFGPNPTSTTHFSHPAMSKATIEPYLFFNGNCEQAVEFYRKALGAEIEMTMRYRESPEPPPPDTTPPDWGDKVMHTSFRVGDARIMASDGCCDKPGFGGFSLSLAFPTEAQAARAFAALSDGGEIAMPLGKTFWSPCFGMLTDRFGVGWMVTVIA
jgi:PhnB protein